MHIGCPKEIKQQEFRVGLTPSSCHELKHFGHRVLIETGAGIGSGYSDQDYLNTGAEIISDADSLFEQSELIVKVKEPQAIERQRLCKRHTLFTYLHLAPDPEQTRDLINSGASCIAYELVSDVFGQLPLLAPMSEIAGRLSIQAGARCLEKAMGGRGVLLAGVPGVAAAKVIVLGAGVVGSNAISMAVGMGAQVYVLDNKISALRNIDKQYGNRVNTLFANKALLDLHLRDADLVIGAVLVPGAAAPKLISRKQLAQMQTGSVLVDVAIDQGGCFESSRPTSHAASTYIEQGVVHYCVANMPGAVARTASQALNNATLPFVLELAEQGTLAALKANPHLLNGLSTMAKHLTCPAVAQAQGLDCISPTDALNLVT